MGPKESRLFFTSTTEQDASGSTEWRVYTDPTRLIAAWQPRTEAWQKFYTPTLMQALKDESLRAQMRPIFTHGMREAFARGETMRRDLLSQVDKGAETFFIADLPGPESVAFGAAMAGWADVVPGFENWPHPYGVVRSHDTLAALMYYAASVQEQKKQLPESAPGLLLLDNQRLAPYTDADDKFDNRYVATVPSATALQQRGVKNIMYIVPSREQKEESDDLNDDFVAYKDAKLKVALFPLNDFQKVAQPVTKKEPDGTTRTVTETRYYYGGGSRVASWFSDVVLVSGAAADAVLSTPHGISVSTELPPAWRWRWLAQYHLGDVRAPSTPAPSYTPQSRPTLFSGTKVGGQAGVGRTKPSGFGRTTFRTSGGRVTSISSGRSGSLGRGGSGSS